MFEYLKSHNVGIVLDSGAFTAYASGGIVDIDKYGKFRTEWAEYIDYAFSLDVIGNAEASLTNYQYLMETYKDVDFTPVWHFGTSVSVIDQILKDYHPAIIGLGGIARIFSTQQRKDFVRTAYAYAEENKAQTHVLGVGSVSMLMQTVVDFADSTSWHWLSRYGKLWNPFEGFSSIQLSSDTRKTNWKECWRQIELFFKSKERADFYQMILDRVGLSFEDPFQDNKAIALYNLEALLVSLDNRKPVNIVRRVLR